MTSAGYHPELGPEDDIDSIFYDKFDSEIYESEPSDSECVNDDTGFFCIDGLVSEEKTVIPNVMDYRDYRFDSPI